MFKSRRIVGLFVFSLALGAAIVLTKIAATRFRPVPQSQLAPVSSPPARNPGSLPLSYRVRQSVVDFRTKRSHTTLLIEGNGVNDGRRPARLWVWTYYFTPDQPGKSWAGEPSEIAYPLLGGSGTQTVTVTGACPVCDAKLGAKTTFYVRVHISAEPPERANLQDSLKSFDITTATPVLIEGR